DVRRAHALAPQVVGTAEHRDLGDPRHLHEGGLDLGGVDVHTATDDEVGPACVEVHVAVLVDPAEVADGEGGTVLGLAPGRGRALGVLPVRDPAPRWDGAPQLVLVVRDDHASGPGATYRAGVGGPVRGRARRELALGG